MLFHIEYGSCSPYDFKEKGFTVPPTPVKYSTCKSWKSCCEPFVMCIILIEAHQIMMHAKYGTYSLQGF